MVLRLTERNLLINPEIHLDHDHGCFLTEDSPWPPHPAPSPQPPSPEYLSPFKNLRPPQTHRMSPISAAWHSHQGIRVQPPLLGTLLETNATLHLTQTVFGKLPLFSHLCISAAFVPIE